MISHRLTLVLAALCIAFPVYAKPKSEPPSYGTGFIVSADGYVLTNNHNVIGCKSVTAILGDKKLSTKIAGRNKTQDLALVKIEGSYEPAAFRADGAALGEDIIVAGFPLTGLITGINITKGNVSGMRGIEGNKDHFQISVPLQPGNSGSPILDQSGNVAGMVIGSLDSKLVISTYGEIPQNINFGIGNQTIKAFLRPYNINIKSEISDNILLTSDIADMAMDYTVLIECKL